MTDDASSEAYIGVGANLGDPAESVRRAMTAVSSIPQTHLLSASSLYRTAPVGFLEQPDFVNAVVQVRTQMPAEQLLDQLLMIEMQFGRKRSVRNAPRTLDLDLLLYGEERVDSEQLTLPHPRMAQRAFVLVPLAEIAPGIDVGGLGTAAQLLEQVSAEGVERLAAAGDVAAMGAG